MNKRTMFPKLGVAIITFNEEKDIGRALSSVKEIADDIVVVDSGSKDKTVTIAKKYRARVFVRNFDDYSSQKNFAADKVNADWILSIDADEEITDELAIEIQNTIKNSFYDAYKIPRKNILLGAEIKHTRWSPDKHVWLWKKGKGRWVGKIHEEVEVEGWAGELSNSKIHYQQESVHDFLDMMNGYTERIADEKIEMGENFSYIKLFFSPMVSFCGRFFYKKGFLDGWRGFILSYLMAIYRFSTWIKTWEKRNKSKNTVSKSQSLFILIPILILALLLRLLIIDQSLWLDEAIGALAVRNFTYRGIVDHFMQFDNHPPLYYILLKFWTGIFGYSEFSLRFPSVLFGLGTIFIAYLISKKLELLKLQKEVLGGLLNNLFSPSLLTVLFLSTSQFHVYYSQEARMYSMTAFFASLTILFFLFLIYEKEKLSSWVFFSLSLTILISTDYVPIFIIPLFWLIAFIKKKSFTFFLKLTLSHVLLIILGLFWIPTFLIQVAKGRWLLTTLPAWKRVAGGANFKEVALVWMKFTLGRISFKNKSVYYILTVLCSIPFVFSIWTSVKKRLNSVILLWFAIPLTLGFLISFWFPAFKYFRFLYVLPAFYIIVSYGIFSIKSEVAKKIIVLSIMLTNLFGISVYYFDKSQHRENWREATAFVEQNAGPSDVIIFDYPEPFSQYRWYAKGNAKAFGVADSISVNPEKTLQNTKKVILGKKGVYYFEYLSDLTDPEGVVKKTLESKRFKVTKVLNFHGVGQVFYYSK